MGLILRYLVEGWTCILSYSRRGECGAYLETNGRVALRVSYDQAEAVRKLLESNRSIFKYSIYS